MLLHSVFRKNSEKKLPGLFLHSVLTYTCVLLLPILLCSFYYFHSYNTLKERTRTGWHLILENAREQVDSCFRDAINLSSHLQLNEYVSALSLGKSRIGSVPAFDRHELRDYLASLQVSNALIQQIDIFFPESGYIVTSSSAYQASLLPYMENNSNLLTLSDWETITARIQTQHLFCLSSEGKNFLTVVNVLSTDMNKNPLAILCIQFDKNQLLKRLRGSLFSEYPCSFALIEREGLLLSTNTQEIIVSGLPFSDIMRHYSESPDSLYETDTKKGLIVDYSPALIPQTAMIFVANKADYQTETTRLLEIMLLTLSICIFAGIFVILYISRKNYQPVSRIIHYINPSKEARTEENEYHLIMEKLRQNRNEIERQREQLLNNYLQKICTGEISYSQLAEPAAQYFSVSFPFPDVCAVILFADEKNCSPDDIDLLPFIIQNVFTELLSECFSHCYFCSRERRFSVLINISKDSIQPDEQIYRQTQRLISFLEQFFKFSLYAGISGIHNREQIPDACMQAESALEYRHLFNTGNICRFNKIPKQQKITVLPLETSEYIINLVLSGNPASVREYFDAIKRELKTDTLSYDDAKSCYYFFYQATARLKLYCSTHYNFLPEALDFLDESFFAHPLSEALSQSCEAYCSACTEISDQRRELASSQWGTDIRRYIENNYFDANINLNTIAEHFQISPSYLSKKFREQYQESVIDYLYKVRISNSLSLMQETDLKIADIAQMTGFVDSNAFIRIFKKLKGTTPGKYREQIGNVS